MPVGAPLVGAQACPSPSSKPGDNFSRRFHEFHLPYCFHPQCGPNPEISAQMHQNQCYNSLVRAPSNGTASCSQSGRVNLKSSEYHSRTGNCPVPNQDSEETCAKSSAKSGIRITARYCPTLPDPDGPNTTPRPAPSRQLIGMSLLKSTVVERWPEPGSDARTGETDAKA